MRIPAAARDGARKVRALAYVGSRRECPCCGRTSRRFRAIGQPRRPEAACPWCGSFERHRRFALELMQNFPADLGRVLHFAPENALIPVVRGRASEYVTADLAPGADIQADIMNLPFSADRWDLIICSHVLEHVPDDQLAMRELCRVLSPVGRAVIAVPVDRHGPTIEDPGETDPAVRRRRFGQEDHVRLYGNDLTTRLRSAGFDRISELSIDHFSAAQIERSRLCTVGGGSDECMFVCRPGER